MISPGINYIHVSNSISSKWYLPFSTKMCIIRMNLYIQDLVNLYALHCYIDVYTKYYLSTYISFWTVYWQKITPGGVIKSAPTSWPVHSLWDTCGWNTVMLNSERLECNLNNCIRMDGEVKTGNFVNITATFDSALLTWLPWRSYFENGILNDVT